MTTLGKLISTVIILGIIGAIIFILKPFKTAPLTTPISTSTPVVEVAPTVISYACNANKTITATLTTGETTYDMTGKPIPGGSAKVLLSDGRTLDLKQTVSADGVRYANPDESFVFWSKGKGALVLENNVEKSFIGCVQVADKSAELPKVFQSGSEGITMRYPEGFTVDSKYSYIGLGPKKGIAGVKFTIPKSYASSTNLSTDTYMSVESLANASTCTPALFLLDKVTPIMVTDSGVNYLVASTTGAAAGNRYEETVYALSGTHPCIAIRYFVHYGAIENYPKDTVKAFDRDLLIGTFDAMRRSLVVNQ